MQNQDPLIKKLDLLIHSFEQIKNEIARIQKEIDNSLGRNI